MWSDTRTIPFGKVDLLEEWALAQTLIKNNVLLSVHESWGLPDEPPTNRWSAVYNNAHRDTAAGTAVRSDQNALRAALAEGQERYIWFTQRDYFEKPVRATARNIAKKGLYIAPERFTSFSQEQRSAQKEFSLYPEATYLWAQALSLTDEKKVYIPAQVASAATAVPETQKEPLIRQRTTIGLATWPTLSGARLAGALEVIEREAYMVMWFNQLSLPRIQRTSLFGALPTLDSLLETCKKYRLTPHIISMATDAPTHAVAVVLEDLSEVAPRFTIGLKANASLPKAAEGALLEALRARGACRSFMKSEPWDMTTPVQHVGHRNRLHYWSMPEHAKHLEFLIAGEELPYLFDAPWEYDSEQAHLERILKWCRDSNFSCLSVSLGNSRANHTPWYIEMVVLPDLHPTHLTEGFIHLGGTRLTEVPRNLGYTALTKPFTERPHPYS